MADNRIRVLIDVVKDNASKNLSSLKRDFADADGAAAKFKVGASGAMNFVQANAAALAAGAGAAVAAFAAKSVAAFQETALGAGKFADATGIATEDASRWIEVAGDMGISGEAVQGAFQKMNKAIADGKLDQFADEIVRAKDGTVDASASFVKIATSIGAIKDPTERAAAAQKAFGKSYGEIARIMEMDASDLSKSLAEVSDAKVIDPAEVKRAREFQAAMGSLRDVGEDLAITVGGALVPVISELGEIAVDVLGPLHDLTEALDGSDFSAKDAGKSLFDFARNVVDVAFNIETGRDALKEHNEKLDEMRQAFIDAGDESKQSSVALYRSTRATEDLGEATDDTTREIAELTSGIDILNGALSKDDAKVAFIEAQQEMRDAAAAAWGGTAEDQARYVEATRRSIDATINYIDTLGGIPTSKATSIAALIDEGAYAEAQRRLEILARNISISVGIEARGGAGYGGRTGGARATGGPVFPNTMHEVVEGGRPELLEMGGRTYLMTGDQGGNVTPIGSGGRGGGAGGGMVVNVNVSSMTGNIPPAVIQQITDAIERQQRLNGRVWARQAG